MTKKYAAQILHNGKEVELNARERFIAKKLQNSYDEAVRGTVDKRQTRMLTNDTGYEQTITTLTRVAKRVSMQQFFEVAPADYFPVVVGEGSYAEEILKYVSFETGQDFDAGILNTGASNSQLSQMHTEIAGVKVRLVPWAKATGWTIIDINKAALAGNWDYIAMLEQSRKTNWDLGIQRKAFLGIDGDPSVNGLLTLPNVNSNTTLITKYISAMTPAEFDTFAQGIVRAYRANNENTAMPDRLVVPEADYLGLVAPVSAEFPNVDKITYLETALRKATRNPNFEILPLAYADEANNEGTDVDGKNRYVLLRHNEDDLNMYIPVDYTNTIQNTFDGFNFNSVAYGQFSGCTAYRPRTVLYFDWASE